MNVPLTNMMKVPASRLDNISLTNNKARLQQNGNFDAMLNRVEAGIPSKLDEIRL